VTRQVANASILAITVTLGFWVLDFAALGEEGWLKEISELSLTRVLRGFERGIFSLAAVVGALIAAAGLMIIAGIWFHPGRQLAQRRVQAVAVLAVIAGCIWGVTRVRIYRDCSEDRRNSFRKADELTLRKLAGRLRIEIYLSAGDPRFYDFDRSLLGKLRRNVPDLDVVMPEHRMSQFPTGIPDERYGLVVYSLGQRSIESRSTSEEEVLPIIFGLANLRRESPTPALQDYPGYPLVVDPEGAQIVLCYVLPGLIVLGWWLANRGQRPRRSS
jgi:hypothetical protein